MFMNIWKTKMMLSFSFCMYAILLYIVQHGILCDCMISLSTKHSTEVPHYDQFMSQVLSIKLLKI